MMITERQTREKTLPRRKRTKKTKILENSFDVAKSDESDGLDEGDSDDEKECDNNLLLLADAETREAVQREKEVTSQLAHKLKELEGQFVRGGRNILDTYSERQNELEKKLEEIAERKVNFFHCFILFHPRTDLCKTCVFFFNSIRKEKWKCNSN